MIENFLKIFDDRFYLEIMRIDGNQSLHNSIFEIAQKKGIPIIATHPIYFLNKEDDSHEIKVCISSGRKSMTPIRKINTLKNNTLNLPKKCIKFF